MKTTLLIQLLFYINCIYLNVFIKQNLQVWSHFDGGNCPGASVGVKCRLDSGVNGFIHTKNISDKHIRDPEERVQVRLDTYDLYFKISKRSNYVIHFCLNKSLHTN